MGDNKFTRESYCRKTIAIDDLGMCCLQYCTIIYLFSFRTDTIILFSQNSLCTELQLIGVFSLQFLNLLLFYFPASQ